MRFLGAALAFSLLAYAAKPVVKPKKPQLTPEQKTAQSLMKSMSLHDRVAQLVIGVAYGDVPSRKSPEYEKFRHWVRDLHIGGLIVNNRVQNGLVRNAEPHAMALFLNQMQKLSKTPLHRRSGFRARRVHARQRRRAVSVQHGLRRGARSGRLSL